LGAGMLFLPSSPRWLMSKAKESEAKNILKKIRTGSTKEIDQEIAEIKETLSEEKGGWKELLAPWLRVPLVVGIGLAFCQQVTGINVVIYYAPTIFGFAGFNSASGAILATAGVGVINVLMTIVAIKLVDKVGRRPLVFCGLAGMIVSLGILGFAFNMSTLSGMLKWITVGGLGLYIASFAVSLGPIVWLIIAEIYPLKVRGRAMSLATMANWLFNLVVAITFLTLVEKLGRGNTFWLYAFVGVGGVIFSYFMVPETKGHSLEEIEKHWHQRKSPREMK
jgi:sugar porter (SP) family MFS transporter